MTENANPVKESDGGRADLVLDAAAELLLRWGYRRVTVEDVAKHARIGKGTVYLHFRTKDALFLTVLLRAHHRLFTTLIDGMEADPIEVLPSRMLRASYLGVIADPVSRLLYLGDPEVLGRLTHEAADTLGDLARRRAEVMHTYVTLLRAAGGMRTDLGVEAQLHVFGAVGLGFFAADSTATIADGDERADLIAHTVAAALEHPDPPRAALAEIAPRIAAELRTLVTLIDQERDRRIR